VVRVACEPCHNSVDLEADEVTGKFSWKVECAARWNLYDIDVEVFSKSHLAELGSVPVARFLSQSLFGARIPDVVPYGDVTISRELSGALIEILPPPLLSALFAAQPKRDLQLTRSSVEGFCSNYPVRNSISYVDYIRRELPFDALCDPHIAAAHDAGSQAISPSDLVAYGNRFSRFYYGKEYRLADPPDEHLIAPDEEILHVAYRVIDYALSERKAEAGDWKAVKSRIQSYLAGQPIPKSLYKYLRTTFGQSDGPNVTTLLAILPEMFLRKITTRLSERIHQPRTKAA
jgi:lysyl-tRNA synthetase class I